MKFTIMNASQAKKFSYKENIEPCAIISITDAISIPVSFNPNKNIVGILRLTFDDTDVASPYSITKRDAVNIIEFVEKYKDITDNFIVHCEAGISRSAGVAAALSKIYNGSDCDIFDNPMYKPNMLVYNIVLGAVWEKK